MRAQEMDGTGMTNEITSPNERDDGVQRMERFQSLQAGAYWRAKEDFPEHGMTKDEVLLVESIRYADDAPHTVVVRAHPDKYGNSYPVTRTQGERTTTTYATHGTHRFLVEDFLNGFEFEPDHERIRQEEVQRIQGRITDLQADLMRAQTDPAVLAKVVENKLAEKAAADPAAAQGRNLPAIPVPPSQLLGGATLTDVMRVGLTSDQVEAMRTVADRQHEIATIKANWIRSKTETIASAVKRMTPYFEEQAAAALARTEDVRNHVSKLKRGIETLDLYVGKDVVVETLVDGESAPTGEPLTLVQRKLVMDEELSLWCDIDAWFDFTKDDLFVKALNDHPDLVDQIFPAKRCVLAMATSRRHIDYGDPWTNNAKNEINRQVFLLVRDGQKVHRVHSPVETHLHTHRLFPSLVELQRIFTSWAGKPIGLDDVAYTDKLGQFEMASLHYKRFLVLLCGLDHRLDLFGPFYDGPKDFDFISTEFQDRHMRFVFDDQGSTAIDGDRREPVEAWIERMNRYLTSGSRVLCDWRGVMNPTSAPGAVSADRHNRQYGNGMERRYSPTKDLSIAIASKRGASIVVETEVSGYSWRSNNDRTFSCVVDLSKYEDDNQWDKPSLGYLVLDAVNPDDIAWYLADRRSRKGFIHYVRFFKTALKFLKAERAEEADARARMLQALVDGNIGNPEDRPGIIDQTIIAWRSANRGRPFPRFDAGMPKDWRKILDQMASLAGASSERLGRIADFVRQSGMEPLRISVTGKGRLVAYATPTEQERDDRFEPHAWVHRIEVQVLSDAVIEISRRWCVLTDVIASETPLMDFDGREAWVDLPSAFDGFEHKAAFFQLVDRWRDVVKSWTSKDRDVARARFLEWSTARSIALQSERNIVPSMVLEIPIGLTRSRFDGTRMLVLRADNPTALLHRNAAEEDRDAVRQEFLRPYQRKDVQSENFATMNARGPAWQVLAVQFPTMNAIRAWANVSRGSGYERNFTPNESSVILLRDRYATFLERDRHETQSWFASEDGGFDGLGLDDALENEAPADREVLVVCLVSLRPEKDHVSPWTSFIDIVPIEMDDGSAIPSWLPIGLVHDQQVQTRRVTAYNRENARRAVHEMHENGLKAIPIDDAPPDAPRPPPRVERHWLVSRT